MCMSVSQSGSVKGPTSRKDFSESLSGLHPKPTRVDLHPTECAALVGFDPTIPLGDHVMLQLADLGQIASPLHSTWIFGHIASHRDHLQFGKRTFEPVDHLAAYKAWLLMKCQTIWPKHDDLDDQVSIMADVQHLRKFASVPLDFFWVFPGGVPHDRLCVWLQPSIKLFMVPCRRNPRFLKFCHLSHVVKRMTRFYMMKGRNWFAMLLTVMHRLRFQLANTQLLLILPLRRVNSRIGHKFASEIVMQMHPRSNLMMLSRGIASWFAKLILTKGMGFLPMIGVWHMGRLLEHVHQVRMANGTSTKPIVMLPVMLLHGWIHASAAPMKKWLMDHYVEGATVVGVANTQAHWIPIIAFPGEVLHVHTFDHHECRP